MFVATTYIQGEGAQSEDLDTGAVQTRAYVTRHQHGDREATTALVFSRLPMLAAVARHVHVDPGDYTARREVQMQTAIAAFLDVLDHVSADDPHLIHNLYWCSMHAVSSRRRRIDTVAYGHLENLDVPAPDVHAFNAPGDVVDELLAAAHRRSGRALSPADQAILRCMYARADSISVTQLAREMNLTESAAESRLRRAVARLRTALTTPSPRRAAAGCHPHSLSSPR